MKKQVMEPRWMVVSLRWRKRKRDMIGRSVKSLVVPLGMNLPMV